MKRISKSCLLALPLVLVGLATARAGAPQCADVFPPSARFDSPKSDPSAYSEAARDFMVKSGMIADRSEYDLQDLGISQRWRAIEVVPWKNGINLVLMNLTLKGDDGIENGHQFQVVALTDKSANPKFALFEDVIPIPKKLIAAIGPSPELNQADAKFFYVQFEGPSVVAALKAILTKTEIHGFSGYAVPGNKAPFDPTEGRKWFVYNPEFRLDRDYTPEVDDINANQLDLRLDEVIRGNSVTLDIDGKKVSGARVQPWNASIIRAVLIDGKWVDPNL